MHRTVASVVLAACAAAWLLTGCSAATGPAATGPAATGSASSSAAPSPTRTPTALERWRAARALLATQTRPWEIECLSVTGTGTAMRVAAQPVQFYSFQSDDADQWKPYLRYRDDSDVGVGGKQCNVNVPTTQPYTIEGLEGFLNPLGFWFVSDSPGASQGLQHVEIAYAGASGDDLDAQYRDAPGLWGLAQALGVIGGVDAQSRAILEPTTDETALRYLQFAQPLLEWYGYDESDTTG